MQAKVHFKNEQVGMYEIGCIKKTAAQTAMQTEILQGRCSVRSIYFIHSIFSNITELLTVQTAILLTVQKPLDDN